MNKAFASAVLHKETSAWVGVFFGVMAIALAMVVFSGATLAWDGSNYLYMLLDRQSPFLPNGRLGNWLLQWPVLFLSHFSDDTDLLRITFGLAYASSPLLSLMACWWIVKDRIPALLIWPAMGIGMATLPGQLNFVSEGIQVVHWTWPVLLAIQVKAPPPKGWFVVVIVAGLVVAHPFGAIMLAVLVSQALLGMTTDRERRRYVVPWLVLFSLAMLLALARFLTTVNDYEMGQLSWAALAPDFRLSVIGFPLVALILLGLAMLMVFVAPLLLRQEASFAVQLTAGVELLCLVGAGGALVLWASRVDRWANANGYSDFALLVTMPFMALSAIESQSLARQPAVARRIIWRHRSRTLSVIGLAFSVVVGLQSIGWHSITQELKESLMDSKWSCMSTASLGWLARTPLRSWTTPLYSILIQGRTPTKIALPDNACLSNDFDTGIPLNKYVTRHWQGAWFDFSLLRDALNTDPQLQSGCWFGFGAGWHSVEENGTSWWRWSNGQSVELLVYVDQATDLILAGRMQSAQVPNQLDVHVNGIFQGRVNVDWNNMRAVGPFRMSFEAGVNTIRISSATQSISSLIDQRPRALAVADLVLTAGATRQSCEWRR